MYVSTVRLPQDEETPVAVLQRQRFTFRYAYSRSGDTRGSVGVGQDYLTFRHDGQRLAFSLCDGVSQSFFGDLAARVLGEVLTEWLWSDIPQTSDIEVIRASLFDVLRQLVAPASEQVRALQLPHNLPPMVRTVLEQKRMGGSESTFIGGLIDTVDERFILAWMGDSRIRLWGPSGESTYKLGDTFNADERWSTRLGPIGQLHVFMDQAQNLARLTAYSDGLATLDGDPLDQLSNARLDKIIAQASEVTTKDDVSFVEIWMKSQARDISSAWLGPVESHAGSASIHELDLVMNKGNYIPSLDAKAHEVLQGRPLRRKTGLATLAKLALVGLAGMVVTLIILMLLWSDLPIRTLLKTVPTATTILALASPSPISPSLIYTPPSGTPPAASILTVSAVGSVAKPAYQATPTPFRQTRIAIVPSATMTPNKVISATSTSTMTPAARYREIPTSTVTRTSIPGEQLRTVTPSPSTAIRRRP